MKAVTIFETWRGELAAALVAAQEVLAGAIAEMRSAEAAFDAARAQHQLLREAIAPLRSPAYAIAARLRYADENVHDLGNTAGRARGAVTAAGERSADLQQALRELTELMTPIPVSDEEATNAAN